VARLLLTLTLAAALLAPAAAGAERSHAPHGPLAATPHGRVPARRAALGEGSPRTLALIAAALAERYWGAVPCGGQLAVRAAQPLASGLDSTTDGWATFESSLGDNNLEAPASTYTRCTISLARWQWPSRLEIESDWNMFCLTVVHEMGHLLGYPHSSTRGSVMAPVFVDETSVPPVCSSRQGKIALRGR
jgi:hypothetical protein